MWTKARSWHALSVLTCSLENRIRPRLEAMRLMGRLHLFHRWDHLEGCQMRGLPATTSKSQWRWQQRNALPLAELGMRFGRREMSDAANR